MYYVVVNDGTKLAVEDINPQSHKVIVLVHGWPISKEMYEYQKNILVNLGYRIISYDIRGFGESDIAKDGYQYDQLATDLYYVIENSHAEQIILVGFSMGGAIVTHYMAMYQNHKVKKLVLLGAAVPSYNKTIHNPFGHTEEDTNQLIDQLFQDRPNTINNFGNQVFALHHSKSFTNWFRNLCFRASGIGTIKTAISLRDEDVFCDLSKIQVPTGIFHGKLDLICPYELTSIMKENIPNATLFTYEFSGHGIFYDELNKFNQEFINYIEK